MQKPGTRGRFGESCRRGCCGAARRPASNDYDVVHPATHGLLMIASYPDFGRDSLLDRRMPQLRRAHRFVLTFAPEDEVAR